MASLEFLWGCRQNQLDRTWMWEEYTATYGSSHLDIAVCVKGFTLNEVFAVKGLNIMMLETV